MFKGRGAEKTFFFFYLLKIPRQYSLVLLVDANMGEGKALGSGKVTF
jgi:hypothetical protein